MNRYASGLSRHPEPAVAVAEAIGSVVDSVGVGPDLVVVMVSGAMAAHLPDAVETVTLLLQPGNVLAVTASGVLGGSEEVENDSAIVVWAGHTGRVAPCRLETLPGSPPLVTGLPTDIESGSTLLVLADPYTFAVDALIDQLAEDSAETALAGGLASLGPAANRLWLNGHQFEDGAVGVILPPGVVAPVVSQGCRPVGKPWTITASSGQMIQQLGGAPALDRLNEMVAELSTRDRLCASQGLHIGIVVNEQSTVFERGDFLIRGVLGADRENGWVAVGAEVAVGQTVQFQVRDAASAHEDLEHLLPDTALAAGALVFTCNGRGAHLFAEPSHDAALISEATTGGVAGMFCAGELGPIGQVNAVHGFTAMVLLFP